VRKALAWVRENRYRIRGWFWVICVVPTLIWWRESILWVALMSIAANIDTSFGAHQAYMSRKQSEAEQQ